MTENSSAIRIARSARGVDVRDRVGRKRVLLHPFLDEKITVGLLWFVQAQLLARHIRGDLDAYPPFIWK